MHDKGNYLRESKMISQNYADGLETKIKNLEAKLAEIELTEKVQGWRQTEMMLEDAYARMDIMSKQLAEAEKIIRCVASIDVTATGANQIYVNVAKEFLSKLDARKGEE
jgi:hypothetical protein